MVLARRGVSANRGALAADPTRGEARLRQAVDQMRQDAGRQNGVLGVGLGDIQDGEPPNHEIRTTGILSQVQRQTTVSTGGRPALQRRA